MRYFTEPCELATPQLVEDLARLFLGVVVDLLPLIAREQAERSARDIRVPTEGLVRRDQPVAAERHRVPRDAAGRERSARVELKERAQVERAACDEPLVEGLGARGVARARPEESAVPRVQRVDGVVETIGRRRRTGAVLARYDRELELQDLLRAEGARDLEDVAQGRVRRGPQGDFGRSAHAVPPDTLEDEAALTGASRGCERLRAQVVAVRAHREHVTERRLELELDLNVDGMGVRVQHADALPQAVREEARAPDGECLGGVSCRAEGRAFRVHELEGRHVVLLGVRRKEDRPGAVHSQPVPGEVLRVVVIEAEGARRAEG